MTYISSIGGKRRRKSSKKHSKRHHKKSYRGGSHRSHRAVDYLGLSLLLNGKDNPDALPWFYLLHAHGHGGKIDPLAYLILNKNSSKTDFQKYALYHAVQGNGEHFDYGLLLASGLLDKQGTKPLDPNSPIGGRRRRRKTSHKKRKTTRKH